MAGFLDKYPHLPGHLTEFKDGGLKLTKEVNPPSTDSLLLLGTSVDGPIMEPVKVDSETYEAVFGKCVDEKGMPNGATLSQAFEEAYAAGCRDIRLMRVSGEVSKYTLEGAATKKVEDKVLEGLLGASAGNTAVNSTFYLQDEAIRVTEVQANGITLTPDQYDMVLSDTVAGKWTNVNKDVIDEDDCTEIHIIQDTTDIVVIASDDIYENDSTKAKVWGESIKGATDGHTIVLHSGVDYVKKGESDAEQAYIDNSKTTIVSAKEKDGRILKPLKRTKITVKDSVTDAGSFVVIKYEDLYGNIPVENASDISGVYKAEGSDMEFILTDEKSQPVIPVSGMTKLYFDGVEYTELDTVADSAEKVFKVVEYTEGETKKAKLIVKSGRHAKRGSKITVRLLYKLTTTYTPIIGLETAFGGRVYDECQVQVDSVVHQGNFVEKIVKIFKPKSKRSQPNEAPLTYSSVDYPTFALLARAINNDNRNLGLIKPIVRKDMEQTPTNVLNAIPTPKNFSGGEDGLYLSKQEMFEKLSGKKDPNGAKIETGAYGLLENYSVDMVVPTGVCADDELVGKFDNFAYELALFCAVSSHRNHATMGMIKTSSPDDASLKSIEAHTKKLESLDNVYFMRDMKGNVILNSEQQPIDLGRYISVIAGGDVIINNTRLGAYANNSAAAYAGFLSALPINSAPTNKVLEYAKGLKIKYSNNQLDRLTDNRYITFKYKKNGEKVAVVDAMTCSRPGSDYARQSSMRSVREVANDIREVADPFLGEPNTVQQRNALSALIDKKLGQHKGTESEPGSIQDYSFQVIATALDELIGQAKIELTIVPAQELRRITTVISLKPTI